MLIQDLNHLDVISEETAIVGGRRSWNRRHFEPRATATADAFATAIGRRTDSDSYTEVDAVAGLFSFSASSSYASAKGTAVA